MRIFCAGITDSAYVAMLSSHPSGAMAPAALPFQWLSYAMILTESAAAPIARQSSPAGPVQLSESLVFASTVTDSFLLAACSFCASAWMNGVKFDRVDAARFS